MRNMDWMASMWLCFRELSALDILWFADDRSSPRRTPGRRIIYELVWRAQEGPAHVGGVIPLQDPQEAIKELHRSRAAW